MNSKLTMNKLSSATKVSTCHGKLHSPLSLISLGRATCCVTCIKLTSKRVNFLTVLVAVFWLINYFTAGIILQYSMAHSKLLLLDTWIVAVGL